jgi:hypothetical protein
MKTFSRLSIIFVVCASVFSACSNKDLYDPESGEPTADQIASNNANFEKFNTIATMNVDVQAGTFKVVRVGKDTLCVATESQEVLVPKGAKVTEDVYTLPASSKADVDIYNPLKGIESGKTKEKFWEVIAFEDTKQGDYDYNDLIIHVRYQLTNKGAFSLFIQPIAYGASKTINLFYEIWSINGNKMTLLAQDSVKDTRTNLFLDKTNVGFINSYGYMRHYNGYTKATTDVASRVKMLSKIAVVWYITTGDDPHTKIYALDKTLKNKVDMFDTGGYPYSLVLSGVNPDGYTTDGYDSNGYEWFRYPLENVDIRSCYDMEKWLGNNGNGNGVMLENYLNKNAKVFDVTAKEPISGKSIYDLYSPIQEVKTWTGK